MAARTLIGAANQGDTERVIELLEEGHRVNKRNSREWFPLNGAVESGNYDTVKTLLDYGARINMKSIYGWTPLYTAVVRGHLRIARLLLRRGAKPSIPTEDNGWGSSDDGDTALQHAIYKRNFRLVRALVKAGARSTRWYGNGVVDTALERKSYKTACYLLMHGFKTKKRHKDIFK